MLFPLIHLRQLYRHLGYGIYYIERMSGNSSLEIHNSRRRKWQASP